MLPLATGGGMVHVVCVAGDSQRLSHCVCVTGLGTMGTGLGVQGTTIKFEVSREKIIIIFPVCAVGSVLLICTF